MIPKRVNGMLIRDASTNKDIDDITNIALQTDTSLNNANFHAARKAIALNHADRPMYQYFIATSIEKIAGKIMTLGYIGWRIKNNPEKHGSLVELDQLYAHPQHKNASVKSTLIEITVYEMIHFIRIKNSHIENPEQLIVLRNKKNGLTDHLYKNIFLKLSTAMQESAETNEYKGVYLYQHSQ